MFQQLKNKCNDAHNQTKNLWKLSMMHWFEISITRLISYFPRVWTHWVLHLFIQCILLGIYIHAYIYLQRLLFLLLIGHLFCFVLFSSTGHLTESRDKSKICRRVDQGVIGMRWCSFFIKLNLWKLRAKVAKHF